jgi:hypothetical protein
MVMHDLYGLTTCTPGLPPSVVTRNGLPAGAVLGSAT